MTVLTLLLLLTSCILNVVYGHDHGAFWQGTHVQRNYPSWMADICDGTRINDISMVGTHDSRDRILINMLRTQTLTIPQQLQLGVRAFDIRCKVITEGSTGEKILGLYHGSEYLGAKFVELLGEIITFLKSHPSEFVIMRVKDEAGSTGDDALEFAKIFQRYYNSDSYPFYRGGKDMPSVGEVRGKIFVFQDFLHSNTAHGANYRSSHQFTIQDEFALCTRGDLYDKWHSKSDRGVWPHLRDSARGQGKYFINYLSASQKNDAGCIAQAPFYLGLVTPAFAASGHLLWGTAESRQVLGTGLARDWADFPHVHCIFGVCTILYEGMNILAYHHMTSLSGNKRFTGILMMDFPGPNMVERVMREFNDGIKCTKQEIDCSGKDGCKDDKLLCMADRPCFVYCVGYGACSGNTIIDGSRATEVTIICEGKDSCKGNTAFKCGSGVCSIKCDGKDSCKDSKCSGSTCPFYKL